MDELSSHPKNELIREFVLTWGEMASAWGINRTMAQIHALLYIVEEPLDTDTVMNVLEISRGNANMNIRNLMQWGLVHKVHFQGQRKDYYTAEKDVWTTAASIIQQRQQREIDPIKNNLHTLLERLENTEHQGEDEQLKERVKAVVNFLDIFEEFSDAMLPFIDEKNTASIKRLAKIARMGQRVREIPMPDEPDKKK